MALPDLPVAAESGSPDPTARLERAFIDEFLLARGFPPRRLDELPPAEAASMQRDASLYAAAKLTEVESRAHYLHELHRR